MPSNAVRVCRPSEFGNPFRIERWPHGWVVTDDALGWVRESREDAHKIAVIRFNAWLMKPERRLLRSRVVLALKGKDLACWCAPHLACHADVLLEIANG